MLNPLLDVLLLQTTEDTPLVNGRCFRATAVSLSVKSMFGLSLHSCDRNPPSPTKSIASLWFLMKMLTLTLQRCEHLGGPLSHHVQPLDYANRMMLQELCVHDFVLLLCVSKLRLFLRMKSMADQCSVFLNSVRSLTLNRLGP